jgi:hypothetical protein
VNSDIAASHIPLTVLWSLEMIHSSGARTEHLLNGHGRLASSVNCIERAPKIRLLTAGLGRNQGASPNQNSQDRYPALHSRITSIKTPSFCMTTFSNSLTTLTTLLPQSHDCSYYVSRRIPALAPLWLHKHTDLRASEYAHFPDLRHQSWLANVTCA